MINVETLLFAHDLFVLTGVYSVPVPHHLSMGQSVLHYYWRGTVPTLILQLPPILMPLPPWDIWVPDAMTALPVAVCAIPAIPEIPATSADVAVGIVSCIEWSMIAINVVRARRSRKDLRGG